MDKTVLISYGTSASRAAPALQILKSYGSGLDG